jgi:hypothetical protein
MTSTAANRRGASPDWTRGNARVAGIAYLVTFAASIPAVLLIRPILDNPDYIVSVGSDTRVLVGCLLDAVNAIACVATAVAVFPVVRRQTESIKGFRPSSLTATA